MKHGVEIATAEFSFLACKKVEMSMLKKQTHRFRSHATKRRFGHEKNRLRGFQRNPVGVFFYQQNSENNNNYQKS